MEKPHIIYSNNQLLILISNASNGSHHLSKKTVYITNLAITIIVKIAKKFYRTPA